MISADALGNVATIEVIIPVHDSSRSIEHTVESVLRSEMDGVVVTVVCHNIEVKDIEQRWADGVPARVRLIEFHDGVRSPAGPKNHGLLQSNARYVSFVDSDDMLESKALAAWFRLAESRGLAAVISAEQHASGRKIRTPPARPWRQTGLDAVRDRLSYRTAPLGLIRRSTLLEHAIHFAEGFPTGEDQLFTSKLWFSGEPIGFDRRGPAYVVGNGAESRVTFTMRSLASEFAAIEDLLASSWWTTLGQRSRRAVAVRIVRVQVFAAATTRSRNWADGDREVLAKVLSQLASDAPAYSRPLSIADRRLIDALARPSATSEEIERLASRRRRFWAPAALVPRELHLIFHREAPIRFIMASLNI